MDYKDQIDKERLPRHVAIIMDGNGRWAKKQGMARMFGHKQGVETVHNITVAAVHVQYRELEPAERGSGCADDLAGGYDREGDADADE